LILAFGYSIVFLLDRLHGIDKEIKEYSFIRGFIFFDVLEEDLVAGNLAIFTTFFIRTNTIFPSFAYQITFKDYERSYVTYILNSLIAIIEPKGYSQEYRDILYHGESDFLRTERFRHSTLLEYVYAAFPTIIIVYILVPSLFLLYSLDEDLDPKLTIKVIGHQ